MSHIVSDQQRRKPKRPKAAGEGEQSERGKPVLTISQRSHRRRSQDIAEDHGFSPPKDDNYPSAVELGFSPPKGQMNRFLENNDDDDEDDRQNDAMNVQTKRTEKKKSKGMRLSRKMHLDTTSAILCMSVLGVQTDAFLQLLPETWTVDSMRQTLIELGELEITSDPFLNAIGSNFELSNEGFMGALCVLKSVHIKDPSEAFVALFSSRGDGKVSKKDILQSLNAAIPAELNKKEVDEAFRDSKVRCKEFMKVFDTEKKGHITYQDIVKRLKEDPKRVGLLSMNLVREKKWQKTSICACRGKKVGSLMSFMKKKRRAARQRVKDAKNAKGTGGSRSGAAQDSTSGDDQKREKQIALEVRRKAREKQRAELRKRISNQKKNLAAAQLTGKASNQGENFVTLVVKDGSGEKKEIKMNGRQRTSGEKLKRQVAPEKSHFVASAPWTDEVEEEEEEYLEEFEFSEDDEAAGSVVEEDFLNESITEEILASSIGSSLSMSSPNHNKLL